MSTSLVRAALTHHPDLVELPGLLPRLCRRDKVPQTDGAERDEAEVDPIQEGPGHLQSAKHGSRGHKEAQNHQSQQQEEVDEGGRPQSQAEAVQEADGSDDQRVEELLHTDGQHQHGEGDADQGVADGEGLSGGRQRSGVPITWTTNTEEQRGETSRGRDGGWNAAGAQTYRRLLRATVTT